MNGTNDVRIRMRRRPPSAPRGVAVDPRASERAIAAKRTPDRISLPWGYSYQPSTGQLSIGDRVISTRREV
jgi:hypothetical protein